MRTVPHFFHKPRQKLLKFIEILGLNNVLNGQTATSTTKGGLLSDEGAGAGKSTHFLAQIIGNFLLRARPVFGITQGDAVKGGVGIPQTHNLKERSNLRRIFQHKLRQLVGITEGIVEGGTFRSRTVDTQLATIFHGGHLGGNAYPQNPNEGKGYQHHQRRCPMSAQQKCVERIFVGISQPLKEGLGGPVQFIVTSLAFFEDARRQHGRQGKSHKGGNDYGSGNDDTELPKQSSGNPLQKHNGKEHRRQRNGGGNHREENLSSPFNTGFLRVHPLLYFGVNVLHNHNGVVHYQTNGQYYGQKGEDVDGKAGHIHDKEGTDERYGYGKGGNERGTPVAQKHKNNEHHQGKGQIDGLLHFGNGVAYVLGIVEAHFGNNVGGQILFQLFETQQGVVHYGNVIGTGLGYQHIVDHGHPVHFKNTVHILRLYNGAAQIPKTDHAVAVLVHHHAVEILHRGETPHGTHRKFRITAFNTSGRQFYIFTRKCGTHIHQGQLISSQFGRIHPQAYGKAFGAPGANLTHTLYR